MPITIEVIPIPAREFSEDVLVLRPPQKLASESLAVDSTIVSGHWLFPQTDDPLTRKSRSVSSPL
jgi:hypothetical protein